MARFEQKYTYPYVKTKVDLYLRYGTEEELKKFFNEINKKHPSIKFDQKYSKSEIEFLDVLVYKVENQRLQTILFKNKTGRQSYLHAKSNQPASLKKSTP